MPLNASGKIDRQALRNLPVSTISQRVDSTGDLTEIEYKLAQTWRDTLPQETQEVYTIDAASDFFHVGGNSILLIELRQLVNMRFLVDLPLIRLFENSTLGAMAATIQNISTGQDTSVDWEVETKVPKDFFQVKMQQ